MNIRGKRYRTLWEAPDASGIEVIDQRHLPHRFVTAILRTPEAVAVAIRDMWVRGAPLIGAAAAYGLAFAIRRGDDPHEAAAKLLATRPTAVNLRWALNFVLNATVEPLIAARQGARCGHHRLRGHRSARRPAAHPRGRTLGVAGRCGRATLLPPGFRHAVGPVTCWHPVPLRPE